MTLVIKFLGSFKLHQTSKVMFLDFKLLLDDDSIWLLNGHFIFDSMKLPGVGGNLGDSLWCHHFLATSPKWMELVHWPCQEPIEDGGTDSRYVWPISIRPKFQGISQQNMAKHMVLTYLHFRILEISHWLVVWAMIGWCFWVKSLDCAPFFSSNFVYHHLFLVQTCSNHPQVIFIHIYTLQVLFWDVLNYTYYHETLFYINYYRWYPK